MEYPKIKNTASFLISNMLKFYKEFISGIIERINMQISDIFYFQKKCRYISDANWQNFVFEICVNKFFYSKYGIWHMLLKARKSAVWLWWLEKFIEFNFKIDSDTINFVNNFDACWLWWNHKNNSKNSCQNHCCCKQNVRYLDKLNWLIDIQKMLHISISASRELNLLTFEIANLTKWNPTSFLTWFQRNEYSYLISII